MGRPVSEGGDVGVDSGGESLKGEGGRRQGQSTEHRGKMHGPRGVHDIAILYTLVGEKVSCHQQAEQLRVSSGVAGKGLVDGLRGGLETVEDPQTLSLRLSGEQ